MAQLFLFSFYIHYFNFFLELFLKLKIVDAIGKRLREERKRLSLTQKQLADKSGILERSISDYECDKSDPSVRNWQALAGAGVDISYVLLGIPTPFQHLNDISYKLNGVKKAKLSRQEIINTIQMLLEQLK